MLFKAVAAAAWFLSLFCGLNILGQVALCRNGWSLCSSENVGWVQGVVLIGAPLIVAAMLSRDLSEETR
jgi:hypothetical protein